MTLAKWIMQTINKSKEAVNVKLRCFQCTRKLQSWFSIKDRQALLNRLNVVYKLTCSCGASYIGQTQRNLINRIEEHRTSQLFSMQTLASQPRSSGWLSQPWGHWQWQQLATAAYSWIFIDSRTQTRAESRHPVYASAFLICKRASCLTHDAYPAESYDYVCIAPLRHYRNSHLRFSFFTAHFSWMTNKNLQNDHCSSIYNALMMITGVIETFEICHFYRFLWPRFSL